MITAGERRSGIERRKGPERRKPSRSRSRRHKVSAAAGALAGLSTYAAAVVSEKYGVPLEVTAPIVGGIFALATQAYNKFLLPWLD